MDDRLVAARGSMTTRNTKWDCARAFSTTTSVRTACARTCRCRLRPRVNAHEALDHVLLYGPPGLGQDDACVRDRQRDGRASSRRRLVPCSRSRAILAAILTNLQDEEVLFIDEIHRMSPAIEEILYPALEDYELDIVHRPGAERTLGEGAAPEVHPRSARPRARVC
ncbi:MAG: hypothetical protein QM736_27305 [Vicinamibacterales bacterium]